MPEGETQREQNATGETDQVTDQVTDRETDRETDQEAGPLTLLVRLAGPMQSWGTQSAFSRRDTGLDPSKSGVIGLLAAALGRPREASVADLAALQMGVRVDHEGVPHTDFHTAGGSPPGVRERAERARSDARYEALSGERASPGSLEQSRTPERYGVAEFGGEGVRTVLSYRAYLADANFLVGLMATTPAAQALLRQLDRALAQPVWPLFLGRKAFVPAEPVRLPDQPPLGPGLRPLPLRTALLTYPWPLPQPTGEALLAVPSPLASPIASPTALRFVFDVPAGAGIAAGEEADSEADSEADFAAGEETRYDVPLSFTSLDRRYAPRVVRTEFLDRPAATPLRERDA